MASEAVDISPNTGAPADESAGITRSQIRGSSLLLAGNVLSLLITFVPHVLLVRYLATEAYGHLSYALSIVAVCKTYALGFNEAISRFVPIYHSKREPEKVVGSIVVVVGVTLLIGGLLLGGFAIGSDPLMALLTKGKEPSGLLLVLMFLVPLESFDVLVMNVFACFARANRIFWARHVIAPGLRVIAIAWVILGHHGVYFLAAGYVLAELLTIVPFAFMVIAELRHQNILQQVHKISLPIREIFSFSVPLMASNLVGMVGTSTAVLLLGYFQPMSTVAYYRVVLPAAALSNIILSNFMPLYMPSASRLFASDDKEGMGQLFWRTATWMSVLAFPIFVATSCFARPITLFLYGERYAQSAPYLAILSLAYYVNVIFGFNGVTLKVLGKVRLMVVLNLLTAGIIVLLNLALIPHYGPMGAAVGTALGMTAQNVIRQVALSASSGIRFFDWKYLSFFVVIGAGAAGLYLVQFFTPGNIYIAGVLATLVSALVLLLVKKHLNIALMFPEIHRLPFIGRLLA